MQQVLLVLPAHKEFKAFKVWLDQRVLLDLRVHLVELEQPDLLAHKVFKVLQAQPGQLDQLGQPGQPEQPD